MDDEYKRDWMKNIMETWEWNICKIRKTAGGYLQESYTTVVHVIQLAWVFLQCITRNIGDTFAGVLTIIQETF